MRSQAHAVGRGAAARLALAAPARPSPTARPKAAERGRRTSRSVIVPMQSGAFVLFRPRLLRPGAARRRPHLVESEDRPNLHPPALLWTARSRCTSCYRAAGRALQGRPGGAATSWVYGARARRRVRRAADAAPRLPGSRNPTRATTRRPSPLAPVPPRRRHLRARRLPEPAHRHQDCGRGSGLASTDPGLQEAAGERGPPATSRPKTCSSRSRTTSCSSAASRSTAALWVRGRAGLVLLAGKGRFVLSLVPRPGYDFRKVGTASHNKISFNWRASATSGVQPARRRRRGTATSGSCTTPTTASTPSRRRRSGPLRVGRRALRPRDARPALAHRTRPPLRDPEARPGPPRPRRHRRQRRRRRTDAEKIVGSRQ